MMTAYVRVRGTFAARLNANLSSSLAPPTFEVGIRRISREKGFTDMSLTALYNELTRQNHTVLIVGPAENQSGVGGVRPLPISPVPPNADRQPTEPCRRLYGQRAT